MTYLESLVVDRCNQLGPKAAEFFGVSDLQVRQWVAGSKRISLAAVEKVYKEPEVPNIEADWAGKDVMLCLPMYKQTNPLTVFSLLGLWDRAKFGALVEYGDAFIVHTREALAHRFLESGKPHSLWIDDDMIVPMGNADWFRTKTGINLPDEFAGLHTANRLRSHEKSIVGGLYFGRKPHGRAMYYEALVDSPAGALENKRAHEAPFNSLRPTKWTGTGCIWINREVFLDIRENNPHLEPMFPGEPFHYFVNASDGAMSRFARVEQAITAATAAANAGNGAETTQLLVEANALMSEARNDVLHNSHLMQGEDQTFGIRAGLAGHQSYVDMGLVCGHVGTAIYGPHNTREPSPIHTHK